MAAPYHHPRAFIKPVSATQIRGEGEEKGSSSAVAVPSEDAYHRKVANAMRPQSSIRVDSARTPCAPLEFEHYRSAALDGTVQNVSAGGGSRRGLARRAILNGWPSFSPSRIHSLQDCAMALIGAPGRQQLIFLDHGVASEQP
jgi:hypothetical protein